MGGGRGLANEYTVDWSQYDKPQTPTDLSPQKSKSKRVLKGGCSPKYSGADASPLSAHRAAGGSPSNAGGSGKAKKRSRQGNGASIPKPGLGQKHLAKEPTTAAKRIERKLISECNMGKVEAWDVLIDLPETEVDGIARRLNSLSGQQLLEELRRARPH